MIRWADPALLPPGDPVELRGARAVAEETRRFTARSRAGAVAWVDGAPGIVVAPAGRLLAVLLLTIDAGRIHRVDVLGGARLDTMTIHMPTLYLPGS